MGGAFGLLGVAYDPAFQVGPARVQDPGAGRGFLDEFGGALLFEWVEGLHDHFLVVAQVVTEQHGEPFSWRVKGYGV